MKSAPAIAATAADAAACAQVDPPPWRRILAGLDGSLRHNRIRVSMYLAFLALVLAVAFQGVLTWQLEAVRAADAELLERAGGQRVLAHQLGHEAALLMNGPAPQQSKANQLAAVLNDSASQALKLEELLNRQIARHESVARHIGPALETWQAARERLWYRAQVLLRLMDSTQAGEWQTAAAALQAETAPSDYAAAQLVSRLRAAADERAAQLRRDLLAGGAALMVLLGVLALLVVEPTARSVAQQLQRQQEQAAELQRLALVAERTTSAVLITDAGHRIQWVNAAFERLSGWSLSEVRGRPPGTFLRSPAANAAVVARVRSALAQGAAVRQEWLHRARDGRDLWLDVDLCPLHDAAGRLSGFVSVATDVSERAAQQAKQRALWDAMPAGVVVRGADISEVEGNPMAERLLGLTLAQLQGKEPRPAQWSLVHEDRSEYKWDEHPAFRTLATGQPVHNETLGVRLPSGEVRWLLVNTEPQRDAQGHVTAVVSCLSDISERRALQDQLSHHAHTDALTQLPNRAAAMLRLQRAIAHAARHPGYGFAVLFLDFDRFKQVNDTLGHAAGDEMLRQIAARLLQALRPGDAVSRLEPAHGHGHDTAARIGGDEFVVVLEGVNNAEDVSIIADRVLGELREPYLIGCTPLQGSASIGVVLHAAGNEGAPASAPPSAEDVLRNADTAMYEAKRAGRGRWVMFDNSMHERVVRTLAIETDLRRALKADELFVVYQPVVDLKSRSLAGVEALVRWRHPERGLVPPMDFIGVAEDSGLIDEIGTLVLRKSCLQFVRWRSELGARAPLTLAVNLSRAQLKRPCMVDELSALLKDCDMRPEWLQLEVTESLAAQDEPVQEMLRRLKALGLTLALDDFGTGYSSLACLHQLPVDTVKVDRSFVQHAQTVEYHRVLIEATIRVARTLGMTTVAEGIETEAQAALMQQLQCDRGQGYLFSKPLEAAALSAWALTEGAALA